MQYTFFRCQGHLKNFLENYGFFKNLKMTHIVGGGGRRSCYLLHYDALGTKTDMWLTPYILTLL